MTESYTPSFSPQGMESTLEPVSTQHLGERAFVEDLTTLVDVLGVSVVNIPAPKGQDAFTATTQTVGPNTPNDPDDA